jgi:hypothetical protein
MDLIPVNTVTVEELNRFLDKNDHVDGRSLVDHGYVVRIGEELEGCFVLAPLTDDVYWLRQLYINQKKADRLPFLIDAIVTLAEKKQLKRIYVHSHQPVVDLLLEALQFEKEKKNEYVDNPPKINGKWWAYNVS